MKPVPEARGQSNIAPERYGSDRASCNVTLTPSINRLSVQSGKWLIAALIMVSEWCFSADEQQFGRLFTTPEQRQRLQELRADQRRGAVGGNDTEAGIRGMAGRHHTEQSKAGMSRGQRDPASITLKGLIYKKDGAGMAFIGTQEGPAALDYRQLQTGETPEDGFAVSVPVSGQSVKLKPGQSWHPESGAVTDPSFPRRRESSKKISRRDTL